MASCTIKNVKPHDIATLNNSKSALYSLIFLKFKIILRITSFILEYYQKMNNIYVKTNQ